MSEHEGRFAEGTKLRFPVYDERGILLLGAGTEITQNLLGLLHRRDIRLTLSASLEVIQGGDIGTKIPLQEHHTMIGRNSSCRVRPSSREVSNLHCRLEKRPVSLYIYDMKSTNGTWLNGARVTGRMELKNGDILRFGQFSVRVDLSAVLESAGADSGEVAQLILAAQDGPAVPEEGLTFRDVRDMLAADDE